MSSSSLLIFPFSANIKNIPTLTYSPYFLCIASSFRKLSSAPSCPTCHSFDVLYMNGPGNRCSRWKNSRYVSMLPYSPPSHDSVSAVEAAAAVASSCETLKKP